jgi:hypothetical protein
MNPLPRQSFIGGEYSNDIEAILEKIRVNCILFSNAHKKRYLELNQSLKWYKIPVILISGFSSLISVSQAYIPQYYITILNSVFGLTCGTICSVELYLGISVQLAQSSALTKEYYQLATDIYKTLSLTNESRSENAQNFLESCYGTYTSLCANSYIVSKSIQDQLIPIESGLLQSPRSGVTSRAMNTPRIPSFGIPSLELPTNQI